jgi:hypothetical protein
MTFRYQGKYVGTIGMTCFSSQEELLIRQAIGRILPGDDGKQVYEISANVYQVENEDQRIKRYTKSLNVVSS